MDFKDFTEEEYSEMLMGLIVNSTDARTKAMDAVQAAKKGEYAEADELLKECDTILIEAHQIQTSMIQAEINGEHIPIMFMVVHAQDILMDAMTIKDMAVEFVELYRKLSEN